MLPAGFESLLHAPLLRGKLLRMYLLQHLQMGEDDVHHVVAVGNEDHDIDPLLLQQIVPCYYWSSRLVGDGFLPS